MKETKDTRFGTQYNQNDWLTEMVFNENKTFMKPAHTPMKVNM